MRQVLVWDLPTRAFHWLLVIAMAGAYLSGEVGGNWLVWHARIGLFIAGLIFFRLTWGLVGSTYARFSTFIHGPAGIRRYLSGQWQGLGHNPLGALSVIGLLLLVSLQITSGLFATNDDTGFAGPFYVWISNAAGSLATRAHHKILNVLLLLIGLHIAAILFYAHVKKHNLVKPMLTGHTPSETGENAQGGGWIAFVIALGIALAGTFLASGEWLEKPLPPPAQESPSW